MQASSHVIFLIQRFEGLRTKAYKAHPSERFYTIGYGHYSSTITANDVCTAAMAEAWLKKDVEYVASKVIKALNADEIELNQNQFDALVSFAFNVGVTALLNSTLWKFLQQGKFNEAALQFLRWNKCGGVVLNGLTKRREAEKKLFLS